MNKGCIILNILIWIISAVAVTIGIYITKNPGCLWTFFFPTLITYWHTTNRKLFDVSIGNNKKEEN